MASVKVDDTGGSLSFPSRPGEPVDEERSFSDARGPGDTVDRVAGDTSGRGDSFDLVVQSAASVLGDSIELSARPEQEDVRDDDGEGSSEREAGLAGGGVAMETTLLTQGNSSATSRVLSETTSSSSESCNASSVDDQPISGNTASKGDSSAAVQPGESVSSRRRKAKHRNRRPKSRMAEPEVAAEPLTVEACLDGESAVTLIDSGSQADIVSSEFALRHGFELRRLVAAVHADLGSDGHSVRLALFTAIPCTVGAVEQASRSFFVAPLPPGIDTILGVPWLRDSGTAVSASRLFFVPEGPNEEVYDFETGRFSLQPERNFENLGFEKRPMTAGEQTDFFLCALAAGVPGLEDYVNLEPRNPLLDDWEDDPTQPDLSEAEAQTRLAELTARYDDVFVDDLPNCLPPFRPINHDIFELVEGLKIPPRVIGMPDRYSKQWSAHLLKFVETGYWSPKALESACSMFAVPKHDPSQARFVINLKPRNANTVRTASPIPDMRQVRLNFAAYPVRSKLGFKKAYEQIRLNLESVERSGFVTKNGTFVSRVMQQGNCNAPDTMHRVCYMMFSHAIGRFLDCFYDDVFVYSHTRQAHLRYLEIIFATLRHYKFYLAKDKVELMSSKLEALGSVVLDDGIEVDPKRWSAIQDWPTPENPRDILRFMGVMQWMSDHLPHLNELAAPLTRLTGHVDWNWSPACDAAFEAMKKLKLAPLNLNKLESGEERLFLFTDASMVGSGCWIGQGTSRETARPFRFHSSKFNSAQLNYTTTDQELLAVLDCCLKFRDHLVGWHFTVVCDHEPLKTYHTQPPKQTRRHVRLWETLSQFDFDWEFIPGKTNVLADSLSRLAELMQTEGSLSLRETVEPLPAADDEAPFPREPSTRAMMAIAALRVSSQDAAAGESIFISPLLAQSSTARTVLISFLPQSFVDALPAALAEDSLGRKVMAEPSAFPAFLVQDGLLFIKEGEGYRLVVPRGQRLLSSEDAPTTFVKVAVKLAHETVGHQGAAKTLGWIRRSFWWSSMHKDVLDYCASCEPCCRAKSVPAKPFGLLHPLDIPPRPWAWAGIDFVVGLPPSLYQGRLVDAILSATCPLSKMVILMPLPSTATAKDVATALFDHVYRRFGTQLAIISDRDPKFTAVFWQSLHRKVGVSLKMSSSAHPQTDGRSEVTNKSVGTTLRVLCADSPEDWADKVTTVEFALNSAPAAATSLSPFEVVYGFLPSAWPVDTGVSSGNLGADGRGERARLDWLRATDAIISARLDMVHQSNKSCRQDHASFAVGEKVYVSTSGMRFPAGIPHKFVPRYVGPFPITAADASKSSYTIAFPPHLRLHPRIHASKLRPHFANDDTRFPSRALSEPPPVIPATDGADAEWEVEKVVAARTVRKKRVFRVRYLGYGEADDQWRPEDELRDTAPAALQAFLDREAAVTSAKAGTSPIRQARRRVGAFLVSLTNPSASSSGGVGASRC